jgi:hypothetical protein
VHFVYGAATGLPGGGSYLLKRAALGGGVMAPYFGLELAVGDFDADGFDDLLVGSMHETVAGHISAGAAFVFYGSDIVVDLDRTQTLTQDAILLAGASTQNELFGWAVAAGDFDQDGVDDVAIGAPSERFSPFVHVGTVGIVSGAAGIGLDFDRDRFLFPGHHGVPGMAMQSNRYWGMELAAGDFDGEGASDLAVGGPWESFGAVGDVGSVTILYGALFADGFESSSRAAWSSSAP